MRYTSRYFVVGNGQRFFIGDEVHITTQDGGGRTGTIIRITNKGIYLEVGNKKAAHFNFVEIKELRSRIENEK